jgi:hypothetical protein
MKKSSFLLLSLFFFFLVLLDGEAHDLLDAHGADDGDGDFLAFVEGGLDLLGEILIRGRREVDLLVVLREKGVAASLDVDELVLSLLDEGRGERVRGGRDLLVLLASEDVDGSDVGLGVAVLAGLGGGDVGDSAREALDADVITLLEVTSRDGEGVGTAGVDLLKSFVVRHFFVEGEFYYFFCFLKVTRQNCV